MRITGPRVSCIVPFCKRTISAEKYGDDVEFICRPHLKFVSRETRERKRQIDRRIRKLTRLFDKGDRRPALFRLAERAEQLSNEVWERCKREAIEGAAGIN